MALTQSDAEVIRLASELRVLNAQVVETELANRKLRTQLRVSRANEERLRTELRAMRTSFSWRITYPVRVVLRRIKRKKF